MVVPNTILLGNGCWWQRVTRGLNNLDSFIGLVEADDGTYQIGTYQDLMQVLALEKNINLMTLFGQELAKSCFQENSGRPWEKNLVQSM